MSSSTSPVTTSQTFRLGDIAEVTSGGSAPQDPEDFGGDTPFVRVSHLSPVNFSISDCDYLTATAVSRHGLRLFPKGTIVFPKSGASIRLEKRAILPYEACIASHLAAVLPNSELVDRDFLFYYLVNTPLAKDNADGYPTLRLGDIVQLSVQVPPLTEQRRIARILSTINRSLEATVKALEACAIVKRSLVAKEFDLSSYSTVSFRDICDILSVGIVVRPTQYYSNEGVIALRSLNVREDELDLTNSVRITSEAHEGPVAKSALRPGDVVIVRTGYPGTSAVIPAEFPQVNCIDLVFARPGLSVRSEYLSRFLNSPSGREQALKAKTGLAQQHLNVAAVGRTSLPLPPLDVQDQIVRRLRTIDRVLVGVRQRKQVLEAVLSSAIEELIGTAA